MNLLTFSQFFSFSFTFYFDGIIAFGKCKMSYGYKSGQIS